MDKAAGIERYSVFQYLFLCEDAPAEEGCGTSLSFSYIQENKTVIFMKL